MLADLLVYISRVLPRGGYRLLAVFSKVIPKLRNYPIRLPIAPWVELEANLASSVFFPLLRFGLYPHQISEDLVVSAFLREGDCVVDVGANIGYVSLLCTQFIGNGLVYSFEPSRVTFPYIVQLASQIGQIMPWQRAVSNFTGLVEFVDEPQSDLSHIAMSTDQQGYEVQCCMLDDWASENRIGRIDFIKMDTEGHDINVIDGSQGVIRHHRPVIEFEATEIDDVYHIYAMLKGLDSAAQYAIYRCCSQYPLSTVARRTNNWFAIPGARLKDFPGFLFRRGFLALTYMGADA